ncbi:constitutive coactivator of PPAR-gamma-like protein 2 isoform X4 [Ambystoma mexicanum]|uniref:constitutive coactivator of PPAR-gamma-like protein 2 isoform X4 n=1 Tax=Ambystoma mexicanum TaxID=8296 RepID=UPI0037E8EA1D
MGVQGLQEFVEKRCPGAVVPVDLLKLARAVWRGSPGPPLPPGASPPPARVLVDAGSALQRLYGGYQTDWVCGGQWGAMLGYLWALAGAAGLELALALPGALGKPRLPEWARRAQAERQTAQLIVGHVGHKGTPPPRAWFLPPACLQHCLRLALLRFRVKVFQTLEDHHLEVVAFYRENGFHGLIAHDSEYALCNIPSYYSSHALKLSWNGKNLTTNQFLMQEVAKQLGLKLAHFPLFAALLGNHILPDEDLAAFHWSLLGPDHPLASLKVRAHQLVLPPCDVVIKAVSEYVSSIRDPSNLDMVGKDVFKHSQSRIEEKIERFKKAVEYYSVATKPRPLPLGASPFLVAGFGPAQYGVAPLPPNQMGGMHPGKPVFSHQMPQKLQYQHTFPPGPVTGSLFSPHHHHHHQQQHHHQHLGNLSPFPDETMLKGAPFTNCHVADLRKSAWEDPTNEKITPGWCPQSGAGDSTANLSSSAATQIPSLLSMSTRNHMDITTPPLPPVPPEVLRVAEHRHRRGLMYPYIYHVLTKGEIKIPVCIEDECNMELPPATILFRNARQYVYGVLFSLAETQRRLERLAMRRRIPMEVPPVIVKEWSAYKGKSPQTPELVSALTFREWTCPNLKKLWLGKAVEDKNRRMRAFLACMKSDTPSMLNPANIPTHLLLMCCVLRYIMQWPGGRILLRHELDAFLAQAVSSQLYEPDQLQELKAEQAAKVERMRQSILEGINLNRQPPPPLLPPPAFVPPMMSPFYPVPLYPRAMGSVPPPPPGRNRGLTGIHQIPPQGGKLEIAGMVVGQWAGSKPSRGRGSFGMQVVSVGGPGKGRGRELAGKAAKGNKKSSADGALKPTEQNRNSLQVNGTDGNSSAIAGEDDSGPTAPLPPCALPRDNDVCSNTSDGGPHFGTLVETSNSCREEKLIAAPLQKEE